MLFRAGDEDTVCALSTPPGTGGISVIRVSGRDALSFARKVCAFLPDHPESHRVFYGILKSASADPIDEVLVSYFVEGRSFTGEETVEISCHGGEAIVTGILKELVKAGCRLAQRGEFTYRAFMNGRLDLVQAESVLALIESRSRQSAKAALRQLQGHLSKDFSEIEDGLVWILAHLEASIDFSTEDIEVVASDELAKRAGDVLAVVDRLIASYGKGRLIKDGLQVALVGSPNAGKSSLLNSLIGEDRAIVTELAGTTRDTIEGRITLAGLPVTFVDTAGLRETDNVIEKMGIERSQVAMAESDLVFHVVDVDAPVDLASIPVKSLEAGRYAVLINKMDLDPSGDKAGKLRQELHRGGIDSSRIFSVSAKTGVGLEGLERFLEGLARELDSESSNVVTQARHLERLQKIHSCLVTAVRLIKEASSPEFIAFELQEAVRAIHELLGKEFDEQVIDRIFKEFCLGK